jgi:hypothetical protein
VEKAWTGSTWETLRVSHFPQRCGGWSIKKAKQEHMLLGAGVLPELWH